MNAASLPARIAYTVIAVPLAGAAGFYSVMFLLPRLLAHYPQIDPGVDGPTMFNQALGIGAGLAFTAGLCALTLPWIRHRKRPGREWRVAIAGVLVILASIVFADIVGRLVWDLVFAAWLAFTMAYTFVRYGVIDQARRRRSSRYY